MDNTLIDLNGKNIVPYTGLENSQIGYQVGKWLAEQVNAAGYWYNYAKIAETPLNLTL